MKIGIDILIEDSYETCKELIKNEIQEILITTIMNSNIEDNEIIRVNKWDEIYEQIQKIRKEILI